MKDWKDYTKKDVKRAIKFAKNRYKDFIDVQYASRQKVNKVHYKSFSLKFPNLFSMSEFVYFLRHRNDKNFVDSLLCPYCGKRNKLMDVSQGYRECCSVSCSLYYTKSRREELCLERYGVKHPAQLKSTRDKYKKTCQDHFGTDNYFKTKQFKKQSRKTKKSKYGDATFTNHEKAKQTLLDKYGADCAMHVEEFKNKCLNSYKNHCKKDKNFKQDIQVRRQQTCKNRYGEDHYSKTENFIDRIEATNFERYGVKYPYQNEDLLEKSKQTKLQRYGDENYNNKPKAIKTCLERYGVTNYCKTEEYQYKSNATKRKNGTFNTSQPEEDMYKLLCKCFGKRQVKRQYRSDLYPFSCDFYLPKFDLYIEYNGSWTHGGEPYNPRKKSHKLQLQSWVDKDTTYYSNAIQVWTSRDPLKRKTASNNNLRYIEFWSFEQVQDWLNKYGKAKRFSKGMLRL